jgi:hypothetical protein
MLTNGSGSGRPKNLRIRLQIPNTALSLQKNLDVLAWLLRKRPEGEEEEAEPRQRRRLQQRLPEDGRGAPGRVGTENALSVFSPMFATIFLNK